MGSETTKVGRWQYWLCGCPSSQNLNVMLPTEPKCRECGTLRPAPPEAIGDCAHCESQSVPCDGGCREPAAPPTGWRARVEAVKASAEKGAGYVEPEDLGEFWRERFNEMCALLASIDHPATETTE